MMTGASTVHFFASRSLARADRLPQRREWRIHKEDVDIEGQAGLAGREHSQLLLFTKSRGVLWNSESSLKVRHCVLTKQGFFIIYTQDNKGGVGQGKSPQASCSTSCRPRRSPAGRHSARPRDSSRFGAQRRD